MATDDASRGRTRVGLPTLQRGTAPILLEEPIIEPGTRIHQYELIRELGRGGMGVVWAARDTKLGRRVAIKFLLNASREVKERFLTEALATAQCHHENIVIIHQVEEHEGIPYMVLEFLEGRTLYDVMRAQQLAPSRVVELALPVARALAHAHELGIIHRDLKPENVFVTDSGQVKVLDFGIAKVLGQEESLRSSADATVTVSGQSDLTRADTLLGTVPFMSPEQLGPGPVDHRTDIWALGIMLFKMLAGHHPFETPTLWALVGRIVSDEPVPSIAALVADIPPALAAIVDGCLRKVKEERTARASELVDRLEALVPGRRGRSLSEGENPYPGLSTFQEGDADRFFGREREVGPMVARIRELPITGIVGPSGVGKSSFVRAGIGPALKASGERWEIVTMRPGRQPLATLASVLKGLTSREDSSPAVTLGEHDELVRRLRSEPGHLGTRLRSRAIKSRAQILLFVDQFEELYTLVKDPAERRAFTASLVGAADDPVAPLRVVVSMRSDLLDRVAEDPRFMEELSRGLSFLSAPDRAGLRDALVGPIELVGHRFESEAIIDDMLTGLERTPGALPLLQFAAAKLWDARDRERRLLTIATYNLIGGIGGALATHADDVLAQMNAPARRLTQKIFRRLVTPERTRAVVELTDLYELGSDHGEITRIVDQLVSARLLVVQSGDGHGSVEIVHESLIDGWPALRHWLDEDQEDAAFIAQLSAAAKQWDARGRPAGLLWRGDVVDEARRWYRQQTREMITRDRAFLAAVFELADRGRRLRRAALVGAMVVLGAIATAASSALFWIRGAEKHASDNAARAQTEAARARDALERMQQKERERLAAEARKTDAEKRQAEATIKVAESERVLAAKNQELEATLASARAAKKRAEDERLKAEESASDLRKTKEQLEAINAKLRQDYARLEKAKKQLSTQLK